MCIGTVGSARHGPSHGDHGAFNVEVCTFYVGGGDLGGGLTFENLCQPRYTGGGGYL
jgi:hypothetical protein